MGKQDNFGIFTHEISCIGREKELEDIIGFVDSDQFKIFHVTAPAGHGKSRFSLELARRLQGKGSGPWWYFKRLLKGETWKVYYVRQHTQDILRYLDEVRAPVNLALFIDDAHENPTLIQDIAQFALFNDEPPSRTLLFCFSRSGLSF